MDAPEALWESQSTQLEPPQPHPAWGSPKEAALRKYELPGAPGKEPGVGQQMGNELVKGPGAGLPGGTEGTMGKGVPRAECVWEKQGSDWLRPWEAPQQDWRMWVAVCGVRVASGWLLDDKWPRQWGWDWGSWVAL
ncbi:TBC1 domain family member 17 [Platysternon megacephalum]|uniref:TBC1 domain family member 17 n=1 Tax=Platysternon megacephalum TaxID=55544 RepID=A0A4D9DKU3_9SAUR|nr:TBC1 domain family member 17 [Platysternon megacephalum]